MSMLAEVSWIWHFLLGVSLFVSSIFLILLVLVQRGRGGGLTGALGGMGGQSAFGTKAGDVFTRITVVTALIWIVLCIITIQQFREEVDTSASLPTDPEQTEASDADEPGIRGLGGDDATPEQ